MEVVSVGIKTKTKNFLNKISKFSAFFDVSQYYAQQYVYRCIWIIAIKINFIVDNSFNSVSIYNQYII